MSAWLLQPDMVHTLRLQGRVLLALMLRETRTRFGKHRLGYLWALFEPLSHVLILIAIFSVMQRRSPIGGDIALFFVTGIAPYLLFSHLCGRVASAINANQALLAYPQITPLDCMLARVGLELATMTLVFVLLVGGFAFAGRPTVPEAPLEVLAAWLCTAAFGTGLGMLNCAITLRLPAYEKLFSAIITRPLYFVSGIFFVAGNLPQPARDWLLWNPLLHMIEWVRSGFFLEFDSQYVSHPYAVGGALVMLLVGLIAERASRSKARET